MFLRSPLVRLGATLAAAAIVWFASTELAWPVRLFTTFLVAVLPVLLLAQLSVAEAEDIPEQAPRSAVYLSSAAGIWLLAALAGAAVATSGFTRRLLGLVVPPAGPLLGWTAAAVLVGLALMAASRMLRVRESRLLMYLLPRTGRQKLAFVGLSLSAGVGEEFVFRSVLIPALSAASDSILLATVLSSGVFGLVHSYQHAGGVIRATLLGFVLAVPFVVSGSVLPSMIAHAVLDVVAGLWLADWLLRN